MNPTYLNDLKIDKDIIKKNKMNATVSLLLINSLLPLKLSGSIIFDLGIKYPIIVYNIFKLL